MERRPGDHRYHVKGRLRSFLGRGWANLVMVAVLLGLLAVVAMTAPTWTKLLRRDLPAAALEEMDEKGTSPTAPGAVAERRITVKLLFPAADRAGLVEEDRGVPFSDDLALQLRAVVQEVLKGPQQPGLLPVAPAKGGVLAVFVTETGIAYVDLTRDVIDASPGGSEAELVTVYAIVNALTTNFPAVKRVQILLDGVPATGRHVDLTRPLLADASLLASSGRAPGAAPSPLPSGAPGAAASPLPSPSPAAAAVAGRSPAAAPPRVAGSPAPKASAPPSPKGPGLPSAVPSPR